MKLRLTRLEFFTNKFTSCFLITSRKSDGGSGGDMEMAESCF